MATTMYFEEVLKDTTGSGDELQIEFGRSSYLHGQNLVYLTVNGKSVILDEEQSRAFCQSVARLGHYLGFDE